MPSLTKIKGLSTYHSEVQREPGSLTVADNIVINADNTAEPRRGMKNYGTALPLEEDRVKQMLKYRDRILRHYNGTLQFDSDGLGNYSSFDGVYNEPEAGIRMKSAQSNGNLYFTTTDGIKKISALNSGQFTSSPGYITSAGGPKALDVVGSIIPTVGGFLVEDSAVSYRIVWGIRDTNDNVILGEPSGILVITNPSGSVDADVSLTISVPSEIDKSDYFYQVYRTGIAAGSTSDPGDDMNLVFEENYDDILAPAFITIVEQQSEEFRQSGLLLYTNANSGGGISSANAKPPIAKDIAIFKNSTFYANTETVQNKQVTFLGLADFVSGETKFNIANSQKTREYTFVGESEVTPIKCGSASTVNVNSYIDIYSANNLKHYILWLNKGLSSNPNILNTIPIELDISQIKNTLIDFSSETVDDAEDSVTIFNHGYETGVKGYLSTTISNIVFGLNKNQDYYLIVVDKDTIKFALNKVDALANVPIDITINGQGPVEFVVDSPETVAERIKDILDTNVSFLSDFDITLDGDLITFSNISNGDTINNPATTLINFPAPWSIGSKEITPITIGSEDEMPNGGVEAYYISLYSPNDAQQFIIWFDINNNVVTPPSIAGAEHIEVDIAPNDTITQVFNAIKAACDLNATYSANFLSPTQDINDTVFFEAQNIGPCTDTTIHAPNGDQVSPVLNPNLIYDSRLRIGVGRKTRVTFVDKASMVDGSSYNIYSGTDTQYNIWFNKGNDTPPVSQDIQIEVDLGAPTLGLVNFFIDNDTGVSTVNNTLTTVNPTGNLRNGQVCYLSTSGTLPSPLAINTPYWIRKLTSSDIELYDTFEHAIDTGSNVGRLNLTDTGSAGDQTVVNVTDNHGVASKTMIEILQNEDLANAFWIEDTSVNEATGTLEFTTKEAFNTPDSSKDNNFTGIVEEIYEPELITQGSDTIAGIGATYNTPEGGNALLASGNSVASSINEAARSLVSAINRDTNGICNAFYVSGADSLPGIIRLEAKTLIDEAFYVSVTGNNIGTKFSPTLPESVAADTISVGISAANDRINFTESQHTFNVGDFIYAYGQAQSPYEIDSTPSLLGTYYVVNTDPGKTYMQISSTKGGSPIDFTVDSGSYDGIYFKANQVSSKEENPNYLYYSKTNQPESVPLVNFLAIGSKSSQIERIVALRDALYVIKSDSIYQVTGNTPDDFGSFLYDNTLGIIAPDTAAVLNNQLFFLSDSGVTQVSDTGTQTVSRDIEDQILDVTKSGFNYRTAGFGVGYETDRAFLLYLPTEKEDTTATQSFRFNPFNGSWTRWMTRNNTCGLVTTDTAEFFSNHLILGAGDRNFIEIERKNFDRTDYADLEFTVNIGFDSFDLNQRRIKLATTNNLEIGDTFVQPQYMSLSRFNRLLKILDTEPGLNDTDYLSSLEMGTGDDSFGKLVELATKIDNDDGSLVYTIPSYPFPTYPIDYKPTFEEIGNDYNVLVGELNSSTGLCFTFYPVIDMSYSLDYEVILESIDIQNNRITVGFNMPLLEGDVIHYKGYECDIEFAPQHFGDPGILKHTPETSFVFDSNNFYSAIAAFKSDVSGAFANVNFRGKGPGFWGGSIWGKACWGDLGNDDPFRILVPRNKARNRYLICKLRHLNARERFKLLGVSIKMKPTSTRAYRD